MFFDILKSYVLAEMIVDHLFFSTSYENFSIDNYDLNIRMANVLLVSLFYLKKE